MFMVPRLDQEKPFLGHLGPSPLPVQATEQQILLAEG